MLNVDIAFQYFSISCILFIIIEILFKSHLYWHSFIMLNVDIALQYFLISCILFIIIEILFKILFMLSFIDINL